MHATCAIWRRHERTTMHLIDTDICIDVLRGYKPAVEWLASLPEPPSLPGFVIMELIVGCQNRTEVNCVLAMVKNLPVVWPTPTNLQQALADFSTHHLRYKVGVLDALIAACALGLEATLCTFNTKHFRAISGLTTEKPYSKSSS